MKCDELKVFNSERINYAVEQVERVDGDIDELHLDDNLFYLKSEADKVIAELKSEIERLEILCANYRHDCDNLAISNEQASRAARTLLKKMNYNKYKRSVATAKEWRNYAAFCGMQSSCHNHRGFGKTAEKYTWKECHAWKCVKRWLAIAEKFKEAK